MMPIHLLGLRMVMAMDLLCIDDCDDANVNAYPGAGYNESDPTLCVEDTDGDGYGLILEGFLPECVTINMYDDGDGAGTWLTAYFEVYG